MSDNLDIWNKLSKTDPKRCSVAGCEGKYVAKGLCQKHYMRVWSNGDLARHDAEPFDSKYHVDPITGCWEWDRGKDKDGYGKHTVNGHTVRAHRYSWERKNGPMPQGKLGCHECDNPGCVNPDHVFPGTHQDNHDDRGRKHRTAAGERHGHAKLTAIQVAEIRAIKPGVKIAEWRYGIKRSQYYRIIRGVGWEGIYV